MNIAIRGATPAKDKGIEVLLDVAKTHKTVTLGLDGSISSHRDLERRRLAGRGPVPPTPAAAQVINLDGRRCKAIELDPRHQAELNDKHLGHLANASPDTVRMLFARFSKGWKWSAARDDAYNKMAGDTSAELSFVVSLGDREDAQSIMQRTQNQQRYFDVNKTGQKAYPTVHIHNPKLKSILLDLIAAGYTCIAIEMKGMKKVLSSLTSIEEVLKVAPVKPYIVAFNVTREQDQKTYAASALLLARYGIQASCQKVAPRGPDDSYVFNRKAYRWFHPDAGGYRLVRDFPRPMKAACRCEVCLPASGDPVVVLRDDQVYLEGSNHEIDSRRLEARRMAAAIASGYLDPYFQSHRDLADGLKALT